MNLLDQVERGYGVETYPTARAIHEANGLIRIFCHDEEDDLLRQWLRGHTPKPSAVRRAIARIERRDDARRQEQGLPAVEPIREVEEPLYRALSEGGHLERESLEMSVSHSRRLMVVGRSSDWGMRAYFASFGGGAVWEIAWTLGSVFSMFLGRDFGESLVEELCGRVDAIEREALA